MGYRFAYVGIQVRDIDRSVAFYRDILGMEVLRRQEVPETGGQWALLKSRDSGQLLELNWYQEGSPFFPGPYRSGDELDHLAFECDVRAAYAELLAKGAEAAIPPFLEAEPGSLMSGISMASGSNSIRDLPLTANPKSPLPFHGAGVP